MARRSTQLFIGRLPLEAKQRDLENVFVNYGRMLRCDIRYGKGMAYGFIEYDDPRDAEDAMRSEDGRKVMGSRIVVEWVRGKTQDQPVRPMGDECFRCGKMGHWARSCNEQRGGGGGGGGYGGGRDRGDRGDRYGDRSLGRAPPYSRDRSRSPPPRRYPSPPRRRRSPSPRMSRSYRSRSRERFGGYR